MSDFLTYLAARSFSPQSTLRPKLRSIFEPMSRAAAVPSAEMASEEATEVATRSMRTSSEATNQPRDPGPERLRSSSSKPDRPRDFDGTQPELRIRDVLKPSRSEGPVLRPQAEAEDGAQAAKSHPASTLRIAGEVQRAPTLPKMEVANEQRAPQPVSPAPMNPMTASRPPDRASNSAEKTAEKRAQPEGIASSMRQGQAALLALSRSTIASASLRDASTPSRLRLRSEAGKSLEARLEAAAERSIHISIGRIDVIAEAAPTPARPVARKAQTGISLEEYLRQKKAGGLG